jgi:hypothetical protein
MRTTVRSLLRFMPAALGAAAIGACGGDEVTSITDHTPVTYNLLVNDVAVSEPYTFTAGQTVRVRIKFFNAEQQDLDPAEGEHFGGLTFNPTSLATVTRVTGHNYQLDVSGGTPATGSIEVSFGHDAQADETTFPPADVTVAATSP